MKKLLLFLALTLATASLAQAEFQKCDAGINGGSVVKFASDGATLYAGTNYGNLLVSADKGETWQEKKTSLPKEMFMSLFCSGGKLFAGVCFNGLYVSSDGGTSWNHFSEFCYDNFVSLAANGNYIFAGINMDGVRVSSDGGMSWKEYDNELAEVGVEGVAVNGTRIFAATSMKGVYVSDDDGKTWKESNKGMPSRFMNCIMAAGSKIFVGSREGVYVSSDNGENWTASNTGLTVPEVEDIDTLGGKICVSAKNQVFISDDDGKTWKPFGGNVPGYVVNDLFYFDNRIFAGTAAAGFYSYDGKSETWREINQGFNMPVIRSFLSKEGVVYAATPAGLYSSSDEGTTWDRIRDDGKDICAKLLGKKGNKIFAAGIDNKIRVSSDGAKTWTELSSFPDVKEIECFETNDSYIFFGTDKGVYRSSDGGATWSLKNKGMGDYRVTSFAMSGEKIYAGTYMDGVYASDDFGENWTYIADELNDISIRNMAIAGNTLYVLNFEGLAYTKDNGATWETANELESFWLACLATLGENVILGTNLQGFINSKDNGLHWHGGYIGMNLNVNKIFITNTYIFAAAQDGLYRAKKTDFDLSGAMEFAGSEDSRVRAYPNPCSQRLFVEIPEDLIGRGAEIYSMTGERLLQIRANEKSLSLDVSGLPAGAYSLRIGGKSKLIIKD